MEAVTANVTIKNTLGLHARPAMSFVDVANSFTCEISVHKEDQKVDGKSIMQLMVLAAIKGTQLTITAEGDDADAAIAALCELIENGFDEE